MVSTKAGMPAIVSPTSRSSLNAGTTTPTRFPSSIGWRGYSVGLREVRLAAMRVCVLTTSYPRSEQDVAGAFVAATVEALRARGVHVDVVAPGDFRGFGIASPDGIPSALRAQPWRIALLPAFLLAFRRAAARASRRADLVHAHWLGAGAVAATLRTPFVLQVWGTDLVLARKAPWLARPILRRARLVLAASEALADDARALGARTVRVIPSGVDV